VGVWSLVAAGSGQSIPGPLATWHQAVEIFSDPFYRNGPNDQGVGWNVLASLQRVAVGFGLAALVGIPAGFVIGRFNFLSRMFNPLISLLRPVSPLAWLPIGLLVFKGANPAAIWTIFICSIWPMLINTAVGVQRVPQDYMNVARVLNLSEWKIATTILFPAVLPYMLTGVRLAVGTAWLVIVAAEMLTGGGGAALATPMAALACCTSVSAMRTSGRCSTSAEATACGSCGCEKEDSGGTSGAWSGVRPASVASRLRVCSSSLRSGGRACCICTSRVCCVATSSPLA